MEAIEHAKVIRLNFPRNRSVNCIELQLKRP